MTDQFWNQVWLTGGGFAVGATALAVLALAFHRTVFLPVMKEHTKQMQASAKIVESCREIQSSAEESSRQIRHASANMQMAAENLKGVGENLKPLVGTLIERLGS